MTHFGEVLGEGTERVGVESARRERELARLLRQRRDDVRVAVTLVDSPGEAQRRELGVSLRAILFAKVERRRKFFVEMLTSRH